MTRDELAAALKANPRFRTAPSRGAGMILPGSAPRRQPEPIDLEPCERRLREPTLTPDEAKLIRNLERSLGRKLDEGEALLALDQARAIGEL